MRLSRSFFYTLRENTKDEESVSGNLLTRAGMIKRTSSGVYMYLPLGYKALKNIEKIIREEMEDASCAELMMPTLINEELFSSSLDKEDFGKNIFSLKDRFDKSYVLAPSHEELFTLAASMKIKSYKDMPFSIYQIQNKYRDEERSRYGLIRIREFLMKDAYSFDRDEKGLNTSYNVMYNAYKKIFARLGIDYKIVKASTGAMDASLSEEFQAITSIGEDTIAICNECGYASNIEIAKCSCKKEKSVVDLKERTLIKTPNISTIDDLASFLNVDKSSIVKTLIYKVDDKFYAALVKGDNEVSEAKLKKELNASHIELANSDDVIRITNANVGFAGPIGLDIPVILDNEVSLMTNFIVGANKTDYHYENVNLEDFNYIGVKDIRCITLNDVCPNCDNKLEFKNGIEIANTFKLDTKYSEKLGLNYLDKDNNVMPVWMGCYGIGIERCMAAVVEQNNDEKGIIWPYEIAPFKVAIVVVNIEDEKQIDAANYLYNELRSNKISTILDDRDVRLGVKFNDMDLIGIPIRITIGNKINEGLVDVKERKEEQSVEVSLYDALNKIEDIIDGE